MFDIEIDNFKRKACLVMGDHMTQTPDFITYSSVVNRQNMCIVLMMAALHDLDDKVADVFNTYVSKPNREIIQELPCPEFGNQTGKSAMIVRALYGLENAGTALEHILHSV